MFNRRKAAMLVAEFLGTGVLTMIVLSVSKSTIGIPYFVSLAAGLAIGAMTLVFGAISGAHFNPAITLGLWTVRKVSSSKAVVYIIAQLLGATAAYWLYTYFVNAHWANADSHFVGRVMVAEAAGAFVFSMAWASAVYGKFGNAKTAATVTVGLILGILVASSASGGLLNPAVALGVRSWVWGTYVLGPVLGAVIGFNLYNLLFVSADGAMLGAPATSKKKK